MRNAEKARDEARRRKWHWVVFDPQTRQRGYARTNPARGAARRLLYFPTTVGVDSMKVAAFDYLESGSWD